jgi:hypothetical protein
VAGLEDAIVIGQVGGDTLTVVDHLEAAVSGLHDAHERGLSGLLEDPLLA